MRLQLASIGFIIVALLIIYWYTVRPILLHQPELSAVFKAEASFRDRIKAKLAGFRTKLAARLVMIAGVLVGIHDFALPIISGVNIDPITSHLPDWALPVAMIGDGMLFAYLRRITPADYSSTVITQKIDGVPKVIALSPLQPPHLDPPSPDQVQ